MTISVRLLGRKIVSIARGVLWEPLEKLGGRGFPPLAQVQERAKDGAPRPFQLGQGPKSRSPSARLKGAALAPEEQVLRLR